MSHRGLKGRNGEPTRRISAGTIWKAMGNLHGKDEGDPLVEMKDTPNPSHADSVYPAANMTPWQLTMKPLLSGVDTSA
jgi:hypothetical protein